MNNYLQQPIYLVIDHETGLVYARVPSASAATTVTLGILNSYCFSLPVQLPHRNKEWDEFDFNQNLYQREREYKFRDFPKDLTRKDLLEKRQLARQRGYYIYCLEAYCSAQLNRITEYMPPDLTSFIYQELQNCDSDKGAFTAPIEEYAALQDVEPSVAYQELKLKMHSAGAVKLRNFALQQKYAMKLNRCETRNDMDAILKEAFDAIIFNALV